MTAITLQAVQARQTELAAMIATLQAQTGATILIPEAAIDLRPGEHYAGAVLDETGAHKHHLILMAELPAGRLAWQDAKAWAESVGGELPDRQEQALLYANCKPHLQPDWHWSSQEHESNASYAWYCYFGYGGQDFTHKSAEGCAVAVRRVCFLQSFSPF